MICQRSTIFLWLCILAACSEPGKPVLFKEISKSSGINFNNVLKYTEDFNPYTYRNFYNGGGVALGDINNDGLLDIYFTGNQVDNHLYLNKGNWQFEEIGEQSGVSCPGVWSTGATLVDINTDGLLDIYVCKSGKPGGPNRHNELFLNQGDLTFVESSKDYNLDITGLSVHSAFFDYDKDGDLDCYILTNSVRSIGGFDLIEGQRNKPDPQGNKLLRNDDGKFTDVTVEAGIYSSKIGFGLGITTSDFNGDGWVDIFISNDFFERDYLYLNDGHGGFTEQADRLFGSMSMGSMGADAADLNNDLWSDLMVTEMLPGTIERLRTKAVFESWDKQILAVQRGYGHQYPRNVLQKNVEGKFFQEVGRQARVSATDWSWGALIFDMDNDGAKDIFISNGIFQDLLDRDYLAFTANDANVQEILFDEKRGILSLIDLMPSEPVANVAFRNKGSFQFEQATEILGLQAPSFSNGAAFGDLDNDGDLDLVINNINMNAFVYKNETDTSSARFLKVKLLGPNENRFAVGAQVVAYTGDERIKVENYPSRGFQSSVDPILHLGLGKVKKLDSLMVLWTDGSYLVQHDVRTNNILTIRYEPDANDDIYIYDAPDLLDPSYDSILFSHVENNFVDFDRDRLLTEMLHNLGPHLANGDVDGDGKMDIYIGGAKGQAGSLLISSEKGFIPQALDQSSAISEDVDNIFFDCDNDGDLDLYVASGGRAFSKSSEALQDRLYINNGRGQFMLSSDRLPFKEFFSTGVVTAGDIDDDGDQDLFVGERYHPFYYTKEVRGYLLLNDGSGYFSDATVSLCPELLDMPMITDACFADLNEDDRLDLIISTDWGPIILFENTGSSFVISNQEDFNETGLWKTLLVEDVDGDGDADIVAGNHGTNSFLSDGARMYISDFDRNGSYDYIICNKIDNKYYPLADRDELVKQLPGLKKKILRYQDYASMTVNELIDGSELKKSKILDLQTRESSIFYNDSGKFRRKALPPVAQVSPIYAIGKIDDMNNLIVGGNQYLVKPQYGRYDALPLLLLSPREGGSWEYRTLARPSQVRDIKIEKRDNKTRLFVAVNNGELEIYDFKE